MDKYNNISNCFELSKTTTRIATKKGNQLRLIIEELKDFQAVLTRVYFDKIKLDEQDIKYRFESAMFLKYEVNGLKILATYRNNLDSLNYKHVILNLSNGIDKAITMINEQIDKDEFFTIIWDYYGLEI